ncbi:flagellar biosynthesis protein FlhB [Pseudorhodobacter sp. E13]|uniref:EscU/YscU/HrcU family type III secretion system export apparatus switch protein n=1 Tax=Pseudorhodobacter sp. E13 TaxID=2487931 RepID=UPI000F8C4B4D|nr:flagellar type III secretion system protein FlhB [Pseudorhodobacter sp. E13]RUS59759.1 flagellar biosynthesis protein FlhB [Pseudorhodobacter sp. E13]
MSDEEDGAEKEHEASQKKLDDARQKGEIPRSADLISAASYAGFLLAATALGGSALLAAGEGATSLLGHSDHLAKVLLAGAGHGVGSLFGAIVLPLAPFFLLPALAAMLMMIAQRAMLFTPSKLAPKLSRISPISGFKNKFGRKGLFEFVKSFVKLTVISCLLFGFLMRESEDFIGMIYLTPGVSTAMLMGKIMGFLTLIVLIALTIGGIDYFWQRAEHLRSNRMSRKDMMDEHKNSEGDPHMKAKRRQRGQEIANNRMLGDVPKADVIIVNPTHYAVALKWDRKSGRAPICLAKGVDEIAARIREKAIEAGIPLHSDPPTARLLHASLEIGDEVHPDHYRAVAAAIRFAEAMRKKTRRKGGAQ